jgi:hypothetical protein
MFVQTVMPGLVIRYLVYVRVSYLLLGWWYLSLAACNQMVMGKPRRKTIMSKKITRRALALFSTASLVGVGLVGLSSPAYAAGEIALVPATGSIYAVPSTENFTLKAYFNSGYSSSEVAKMKLKVSTVGGFEVLNDAADFSSVAAQSNAVTNSLIAANAATPSAVIAPASATSPMFFGLAIGSPGTTTNYDVVVQAFIDVNNDGLIGAGEWTSTEQTIRFMKIADVAWNVSLDALAIGATTATANVSSTNVNLSQLLTGASTSQVAVVFEDDTATPGTFIYTPTNGVAATAVALAYDSTDDRLEGTSTAFNSSAALAGADKIRANVYFTSTAAGFAEGVLADNGGNVTWDDHIVDEHNAGGTAGSWTTFGTAAAVASEAVITVTVGVDQVSSLSDVTTTATSDSAMVSNEAIIRQGATAFNANVTVTPESGVSAAGIVVTFVVEEQGANTLDSAATITAGALTLKNTNGGTLQKVTLTAVTDVDGIATIALTAAATKATNVVNISATASGVTAESDFTFSTPTVSAVRVLNVVDGESTSAQVAVVEDIAFTLQFGVTDQFGYGITDAGYSVRVTESSTTLTGSVSNGVASIAWPAYLAAGAKSFLAEGLKNGVDVGSGADDSFGVTVYATASADAATAISIVGSGSGAGTEADFGKTTSITLNQKAFVAGETRSGAQVAARTAAADVLVTGTVTKASGAAALTSVTLSGTGFDFISGGHYASDSITVDTNTAGQFTVLVLSNLAGDRTLTMTSGTVTKTQKFTFDAAADTAGTNLTLDVPTYVEAGRTVSVTGTLTDAFGNPVTADSTENFLVTYAGPGFNTNLPVAVNALGGFSFNVLLGSSDIGTGTVTVSYDQNSDSDYTDAKDLVKTAGFVIGTAPAAVSDVKVNVGSFSGKLVVYALNASGSEISYKIAGKWVTQTPMSDTLMRYDRVVGAIGATVLVDIYVDGVLKLSKSVVTK